MCNTIHTIIPAEPGTYLLFDHWSDYIKEPVIAWAFYVKDGRAFPSPITFGNNEGRDWPDETLVLYSDGQASRLDGQESWDSLENLISVEEMRERHSVRERESERHREREFIDDGKEV